MSRYSAFFDAPGIRTRLLLGVLFFFAALATRLVIISLYASPDQGMQPDSYTYTSLAKSILDFGEFAYHPGHPEIARTPGYPLVLAAASFLFGADTSVFLVLNAVLNSLTIALGVILFTPCYGMLAGCMGGLALVLDPCLIHVSTTVLSEPLFLLVLLVFVFLFSRSLTTSRLLPVVASSCVLAAATYVRPITYYFIAPALLLLVWYGVRRVGARKAILLATAFLGIWAACILPWQARNLRGTGIGQFSTIGAVNLLRYRAAGIVARREGIPLQQAQDLLTREVVENTGKQGNELVMEGQRYALGILTAHPSYYLKDALRGARKMLVGLMTRETERWIGKGKLLPALVHFSRYVEWLVLRVLWALFLLFLLVGRRSWHALETVCLACIVYMVIVSSGPEAYGRFRAPIVPLFVFPAVGFGVQVVRDYWKRRTSA